MIDLLYMQQEFILTIYKLLYFNARDGYRSACFCYKWDIFLKRLSFFRESRRWTWCKSFHGIDYKPQLLTIITSRDYSFTANFNRVSSHWREGQMGSTPLGRPLSHWPTLVSFFYFLAKFLLRLKIEISRRNCQRLRSFLDSGKYYRSNPLYGCSLFVLFTYNRIN